MNLRRRHQLALGMWTVVFLLLGFGVWEFQAGQLMLLLFFGLSAVVYLLYAFLARCPRCGTPLLLRPRKVLGIEFYTWSCAAPENCRHCGEPLH
jgi:hypothetical protein